MDKDLTAKMQQRLREALDLRGKRPVDMHNDLQISKALISQWMSGKIENMSSQNLYKVAMYLNVSEAWLLGYDVPMSRTPSPQTIADRISKLSAEKQTELLHFLEYLESR